MNILRKLTEIVENYPVYQEPLAPLVSQLQRESQDSEPTVDSIFRTLMSPREFRQSVLDTVSSAELARYKREVFWEHLATSEDWGEVENKVFEGEWADSEGYEDWETLEEDIAENNLHSFPNSPILTALRELQVECRNSPACLKCLDTLIALEEVECQAGQNRQTAEELEEYLESVDSEMWEDWAEEDETEDYLKEVESLGYISDAEFYKQKSLVE